MKRPSKKEIQAAVDKLKEKKEGQVEHDVVVQKTQDKKAPNRIRKKGV
ncbi:MAG: hypothetical protein ACAH95_14430 [Fimbriimonas sp.]